MVLRRKTTYTASSVFFIILALPLIIIIALQLWQYAIRYEVREKLEEGFLETISAGIDDIEWKNKKEVSIHGRMFDIKLCEIKDGKFFLTGLFDDKETAINAVWEKRVSDSFGSFINLLIIGQSLVAAFHFISFSFLRSFKKIFTHYQEVCSLHFKELVLPPPKLIVCF